MARGDSSFTVQGGHRRTFASRPRLIRRQPALQFPCLGGRLLHVDAELLPAGRLFGFGVPQLRLRPPQALVERMRALSRSPSPLGRLTLLFGRRQ